MTAQAEPDLWPPFHKQEGEIMCQFFEEDPEYPGIVLSDGHKAAEGPLFFFWPIPGGGSIRVPVCEEHYEWLENHVNCAPR